MKAIIFKIRLNSLYSIRIPFTWQSSLTYPILPSSAVIGLLANAFQRFKNDKHPLEYLKQLESKIIWAGSRLITPCAVKSYITSAIVKWEDTLGGKFTNALGRQYAFTRQIEVAAIVSEDNLAYELNIAVKRTPLTCGDSESPLSVEGFVGIKDVIESVDGDLFTTYYPVPYTKETKIDEGAGEVLLMHERCLKTNKHFPLVSYIVPIKQEGRIIKPSFLTIRLTVEKAMQIADVGFILRRES